MVEWWLGGGGNNSHRLGVCSACMQSVITASATPTCVQPCQPGRNSAQPLPRRRCCRAAAGTTGTAMLCLLSDSVICISQGIHKQHRHGLGGITLQLLQQHTHDTSNLW